MDSILSGFQAQVDTASRVIESGDPQSIISRRLPLEMYAFLLQWFFSAAENIPKDQEHNSPVKPKRGKGGKATASGRGAKSKNTTWNWIDMIPNALGLIVKALKLKIARVWTTTGERDIFVR
jgi:condensin complex subunit 1